MAYYPLKEQYDKVLALLTLNRNASPDRILQLLSSAAELNSIEQSRFLGEKLGLSPENRWNKNSSDFIHVYHEEWSKKRDDAHEKLRAVLVGRKVLQDSLHRDGKLGQKLTSKILTSINNATARAHTALKPYNAACESLHQGSVIYRPATFEEVHSVDSTNGFWAGTSNDAIDYHIMRAYLIKQRVLEEHEIIWQESGRLRKYAADRCAQLKDAMDNEINGGGDNKQAAAEEAQRFFNKVHGREWDSTPLEAVAIDHAVHGHQGLQDEDE